MKRRFSFDEKCFELAEHFLPTGASERLKNELAQHVQEAVEDWLNYEADSLRREIGEIPS